MCSIWIITTLSCFNQSIYSLKKFPNPCARNNPDPLVPFGGYFTDSTATFASLALLIFGENEKMSIEFYIGGFIILSSVFINTLIKQKKSQ